MTIIIEGPHCVYKIIDASGENHIKYGKSQSAFGHTIFPHTVEILRFYETMNDARDAATTLGGGSSDPILCHQTGEIFETVDTAARVTGVHPSAIYNHLKERRGFEKPKGFTFQRYPRALL